MGKNNMYAVASEQEIKNFLASCPGWRYEDNCFKAEYQLDSFEAAVEVFNEVAKVSSRLDHHPRILNNYNQLELSLCTHSVGDRVTSFDIELAKEISKIMSNRR